jgi:large subunit ribosomal protein L25
MATAQLGAKARTGTGKGVARKLRQAGEIPGIIYGHGRAPQPLSLNGREFDRLLSTVAIQSTVIELSFDGTMARTLIREIQRHPFKKQVIHVDFQELVAGEKVTVEVPLVFVGTADGVKNSGGILDQVMHEILVHCDPSTIPNHVDVDVTPLAIGKSLHVSDLKVPDGVEVLSDPEATVCIVSAPKASETPAAGVEVVEAAAEPELIRKPKEGEEEGEES